MQTENMFGKIEVIPFLSYGWDNSITFAAATTCYQSEEYTKKSAEDFVEMFKAGKHRSPLEFSWYVIEITTESDTAFIWEYVYRHTTFIKVETVEEDRKIILSGNGRAFFEFFNTLNDKDYKYFNHNRYHFTNGLKQILHETNPILFDQGGYYDAGWHFKILATFDDIINLDDCHKWVAFRIKNVSIGETREFNRHRVLSINERSTRYTGVGRGDTVQYSVDPSIEHYMNNAYISFGCLKEDKVKNDISRQALPLATVSEEIVAGRYSDWKHFISLRHSSEAHYEIREVASQINEYMD